jgi:hypothetical protein
MTSTRRLLALALLVTVLSAGALARGGDSGAASKPVALDLFVHPGHGGGWTSHVVDGVAAGIGPPSLVAIGGEVVLAEQGTNDDVVVAEGSLFGAFVADDLTATIAAPQAAGPPVASRTASGAIWLWYRTTSGDLELAVQASKGAPWSLTDVTSITGGPELAGDPFIVGSGSQTPTAYAVVTGGIVDGFVPPRTRSGSWVQGDPTGGLGYPALTGNVAVFRAPGAPAATVVLGTALDGDMIELSNELQEPFEAIGPWRANDLTALGAPGASGPISAFGGAVPDATYDAWGSVEELTLTSGLASGFTMQNLSNGDQLWPPSPLAPTLVHTPSGPMVAQPATTGDLMLSGVSATPDVVDTSFQTSTGELVGSSVASTTVGSATALVASDAGPIAATPLQRRIAIFGTSYDQDHRGYTTAPTGSDCNVFTAAFGRGSTYDCPGGTSSEEWCSDFADFVWTHAGVPTAGITGWAATFITWGRQHHRVQMGTHFKPAVGDAIVWGTPQPLYGTHVAIIASVQGDLISVISGNSPIGFPSAGGAWGVWRWGTFDGETSTVNGYPVLGVVSP